MTLLYSSRNQDSGQPRTGCTRVEQRGLFSSFVFKNFSKFQNDTRSEETNLTITLLDVHNRSIKSDSSFSIVSVTIVERIERTTRVGCKEKGRGPRDEEKACANYYAQLCSTCRGLHCEHSVRGPLQIIYELPSCFSS